MVDLPSRERANNQVKILSGELKNLNFKESEKLKSTKFHKLKGVGSQLTFTSG